MSKSNENRREFLLSFFEKKEGFETKQINKDWWLVKHWNVSKGEWTVDIYPSQSYQNSFGLRQGMKEEQLNL